jgi:hypothetical protein
VVGGKQELRQKARLLNLKLRLCCCPWLSQQVFLWVNL